MAEFPAMPLWTDAYLGDTTHLTTIEHGAYLLLLFSMWRTGEARLPADDRRLARLARLDFRQWERMKPTIMEFFIESAGFITQGRMTDEWGSVQMKSKKASDSANAKWLKHKKGRHAVAVRSQCDGNATITTTITNKKVCAPANLEFEKFKRAYPKRKGSQGWPMAQKYFEKADCPTADLIAAASRFAETIPKDSRETSFVPMAETWMRKQQWREFLPTDEDKERARKTEEFLASRGYGQTPTEQ